MKGIIDTLVLYQEDFEKNVLRITELLSIYPKKFLEKWEKIEPGSTIAYDPYQNLTFFRTKSDYVYFIDESQLARREIGAFTYLGQTDRSSAELMLVSDYRFLYILSSIVLSQYDWTSWPLDTNGKTKGL